MNPQLNPGEQPVETVIALLGRAARRKDLLQRGLSDWDLKQAARSGRIRRAGRAIYALPEASALDLHLAENQAYLDCFSKASEMGLWVLNRPQRPHVATAHGRPVPGCTMHRFTGSLSFWVMLRHCVKCGSEVEALCVLESAVVLQKCTIEQMRRQFTKRSDAPVRRIIDLIDPQSQSISEVCGRYHLRKAGFNVQGQASIRGMGHLDLLVEGVLGVETDGEKYHNSSKAWTEDLRRLNVLTVAGVPALHIKASDVMYRPNEFVNLVRKALSTIASARS